jgi:hypothetical protein
MSRGGLVDAGTVWLGQVPVGHRSRMSAHIVEPDPLEAGSVPVG